MHLVTVVFRPPYKATFTLHIINIKMKINENKNKNKTELAKKRPHNALPHTSDVNILAQVPIHHATTGFVMRFDSIASTILYSSFPPTCQQNKQQHVTHSLHFVNQAK